MSYFLVNLRRLSTDTTLSIHIEAESALDALRFVHNQMPDKWHWVTNGAILCDCPVNPPSFVYKGILCWYIKNEIGKKAWKVMFPGSYTAQFLDTEFSSVFEVKNVLENILSYTY